ncbi:MAG: hypothetical protein NTV00_07440 [Methylococcales bacterium]|nr:hypothetical protein [Methylococcales bacterium]
MASPPKNQPTQGGCMIDNTFNNADFERPSNPSQLDDKRLIEQEFNRFIQASPLRQEIFSAISRLETSKIRLIDNEFKNLLNRFR